MKHPILELLSNLLEIVDKISDVEYDDGSANHFHSSSLRKDIDELRKKIDAEDKFYREGSGDALDKTAG